MLDFAKSDGLVTEQCFPYSGGKQLDCPSTVSECQRVSVADYCITAGVEMIKQEIMSNGPVVAVIPAYRDFLVYKEGIYRVQDGVSRFISNHAVKIVGWGKTLEGWEYWIVENSWGDSWGMKGYAHIAVLDKNLKIDEFVMSITPSILKSSASVKGN